MRAIVIFLVVAIAALHVLAVDMVERPVIKIGDTIAPRLHLVENFATDAEMDEIMKTAFLNMQPQDQEAETGIVHELPIGDSKTFETLYNRMSTLFPGVAVKTGEDKARETFRIRRYLPKGVGFSGGDYHPPHTDWFEANGKGDISNVLIITMIVYLTSPEKGGTTYFKNAVVDGKNGYHFQPKRGNLAVWWSCHTNGTQDFNSEHSSEPLLEGIKWNAARFFYDHTKKCNTPSARTVMVPKAADSNVPMTNSSKVMFGTTFPPGVSTSEKGTITNATVHGGGYGQDFTDEDLRLAGENDDLDSQDELEGNDGGDPLAKEKELKQAEKEDL